MLGCSFLSLTTRLARLTRRNGAQRPYACDDQYCYRDDSRQFHV